MMFIGIICLFGICILIFFVWRKMIRIDFGSNESLEQDEKDLIADWYHLWKLKFDNDPAVIKEYEKLPKLLEACELNQEKRRQRTIKEGTKTNWQKYHEATYSSDQSFTPLHSAAKDGQTSMAKALLENQADPSLPTTKGLTPLHLCANFGHLAIAELLLKYKANVSAVDNNYKLTPLHYAAENGHKEMVDLLIANGAKVNASDCKLFTPLHLASKHGHTAVMELLISKRADVNAKCSNNATPLFQAATFGHEDAAACLIRSKSTLNVVDKSGMTALEVAVDFGHEKVVRALIKQRVKLNNPLHCAVSTGRKEIAEILLASGADANHARGGKTLLLTAILHQRKDLIGPLIRHGADVNFPNGAPLFMAVNCGLADIVDELLKNGAPLKNEVLFENHTLMHLAAQAGSAEVGKILQKHGEEVDSLSTSRKTPLAYAAAYGHKEMVEFLLANGANMNFLTNDGTGLHIAATEGHPEVVQFLLEKGAPLMDTDQEGKTALEYAIDRGHLEVVQVLVNQKKNVLNEMASNDWPFLHIATECACEDKKFDMVKLLVANGADLNTVAFNNTAVQIAARKGSVELVEFFLSKGHDINKDHLFNHACIRPNMDVVKFLMANGADINAEYNDKSPLVLAASKGHKHLVKLLLSSGVAYNADDFNRKSDGYDKKISKMIVGTARLFAAVENDHVPHLDEAIKLGAYLNAKNADGETALCMAARMGFFEVMDRLVKVGADPNIADSKGRTPLQLAVKKGKVKNVLLLLVFGAIYDTKVDGKTPAEISENKDISELLALVDLVFRKVSENDGQVLNDVKAIKEPEWLQAVLGVRNAQGDMLMAAATKANFSKIRELEAYTSSEDKYLRKINTIHETFLQKREYGKALHILENGLKERRKKTGRYNDRHTLRLEYEIAKIHELTGNFAKAVELSRDVARKQKEVLGAEARETLDTRCLTAVSLHRMGKHEDAVVIFTEITEIQKRLYGENDDDYISTIFHMAMTLPMVGRNEEALAINETVYKYRMKRFDPMHPLMISTRNNLATTLHAAGKSVEAYEILREVLEAKILLYGLYHGDTCRTLNSIAVIMSKLGRPQEAEQEYLKLVDIQKKIHFKNHPDTLISQYNLALTYVQMGKLFNAYTVLSTIFQVLQDTFGPVHPIVVDSTERMALLEPLFGQKTSQKGITAAALKGDLKEVIRLMVEGGHANDVDSEGRTALHFATDTENLTMVEALLKHGADATIASKKGNTALHTAVSKANVNIVQLLLQKVSRKALASFVNAKTSANATTAMHVAASKEGSLSIIKLLLKNSAIFNVLNNQGKTPLDLAKDASVREFLQTIHTLFKEIAAGNAECLAKLSKRTPEDIGTITRARNVSGLTLYQVALNRGHKKLAQKLLEIQKTPPSLDKLIDMIGEGKTSEVEKLVKAHPEVVHEKDSEDRTALHHAASSNNLDMVKILLKNGAKVNVVTNKGNTPLHLAVLKGNWEMAYNILEAVEHNEIRDFVNAKTVSGGTTALHVAAKMGNFALVKLLLTYRATYDAVNKENKTPLQLSSDKQVCDFLAFVDVIFQGAAKGDFDIIFKMQSGISVEDERRAIDGVCKDGVGTICELVLACGHKKLAKGLLEMWHASPLPSYLG